MRARMDEYGKICKELAEKHNCTLIDFPENVFRLLHIPPLVVYRMGQNTPNQIGATLMAKTFLEKCGFDYNHKPVM